MARKQSLIPSAVPPQMTDDFQLIRGIGPVLAGRLHAAGIHTYEELASMSPAKLSACIGELSVKQITRQNLVGQARKIVSHKARSKADKKETVAPASRQHYENFTIEFLLDEKNESRRTRMVHVQSGDADSWAGLGTEQLINFLVRHTGLRDPRKQSTFSRGERVRKKPLHRQMSDSQPFIRSPELPTVTPAAMSEQRGIDSVPPVSQPSAPVDHVRLQLCDLKVTLPDSDIPIPFLHQGQPYIVQLTVDHGNVVAASGYPLLYNATVSFKQVGGPCESVLEANGALGVSGPLSLHLTGIDLAPGMYRLNAFVRLVNKKAVPGLTAFLKGGLLQVY